MSTTTIDLTERARAVALIADQHAESGDSQGRLADPVVDALHREGLFGMWVPKAVPGGAELDPVSSLQVIENLAYGDPSAGWVLMAAALAVGTGAAFLSDAAVSELFGKPSLPVIAGQGTRPGTRRAEGRRLHAQRIVELRIGHQARHAHSHARRDRGNR